METIPNLYDHLSSNEGPLIFNRFPAPSLTIQISLYALVYGLLDESMKWKIRIRLPFSISNGHTYSKNSREGCSQAMVWGVNLPHTRVL